ncbi:MAG: hypothetical protein EOP84_24705 [Verrucomicrobiaceae bacterium]|nr:MAG: hypothetical protein EOP84_24705 [Verrucomicrobiaceae bacterium]
MVYVPYPFKLDDRYTRITWTVEINKPEEKPNNFTGPRGRLKWIGDVHMCWHNITPSCEDEHQRSRSWKLHRKGWVGLSTNMLSPYEEKRIRKFLTEKGKDNVFKSRTYTLDSDERPGDIGSFPERGCYYFFRTQEIRAEFVALLESIPKRSEIMYVDHKRMAPQIQLLLRGKNWIIFRGEDADLLSFEDTLPITALFTIKLLMGVAKPT